MTKICFVAPYCYPLFNPTIEHLFGGAEVRAWIFGMGLSQYPENEVSFIVLDHKQPRVEQYSRVTLYRHSFYKAQLRLSKKLVSNLFSLVELGQKFALIQWIKKQILHLFRMPSKVAFVMMQKNEGNHPQRTSIFSLSIGPYRIVPEKIHIYIEVNADVYCIFGVSNMAAELAAYCKHEMKKFILFSSSDEDFSDRYYPGSLEKNYYGSNGSLCYYVIMEANLIVTQTKRQAQLLLNRFGRKSVTIYSPVNLSIPMNINERGSGQPVLALWVGKSNQVKGPELLLKLATLCPDIRFLMVLNRSEPETFKDIIHTKPPNVEIIENVRFGEVEKLFARAFMLINTSAREGFPNTFLQAGKFGIPILSFQVDPDGFIEKYGCGLVANGDINVLTQGLRRLVLDSDFHSQCSRNIKQYVLTYHEPCEKVQQLNEVLRETMAHGH